MRRLARRRRRAATRPATGSSAPTSTIVAASTSARGVARRDGAAALRQRVARHAARAVGAPAPQRVPSRLALERDRRGARGACGSSDSPSRTSRTSGSPARRPSTARRSRAEYPGGARQHRRALAAAASARCRGDSLVANFAWEARASTVPRRQGRRGRQLRLLAVVSEGRRVRPRRLAAARARAGGRVLRRVRRLRRDARAGRRPDGRRDGRAGQRRSRVGARCARRARAALTRTAYGAVPPAPAVQMPAGYRAVRFVARDVHHFAWSTSPGLPVRGWRRTCASTPASASAGARARGTPSPCTRSTSPATSTTWGGGRVVERTRRALGVAGAGVRALRATRR